ncbi:hypothetical protein BGX21_010382 [Mortierella sp. AD011]|nr:hypothetical protein BGX20_010744 [Mortierella sp. AD010]KAF9394383.1 hypothetical protein BGX21_010382 [Mortierella sp. AD011]
MLRICDSAYGIQHLDLMDSDIDDDALAFIAEACPKLKSLDLSRNEAVTFCEIIKDHQIAHGYDHAGMRNGMESMPISESTTKEMDLVPAATFPAQYEGAPYSVNAVTKQRDTFNREYSSNRQQPLYQNQQPNHAQLQARLASFCCYGAEPDHCISSERQPLPKPTLLQMQKPFMYLEELSLVFCLGITNNEFQALFWSFRHKNLRSLNLQFTNIEDSGLETLARALTLPMSANSRSKSGSYAGLKSINVSYCSRITARGIKALIEGCPQLLDLDFLCCDQVSAECFRGPLPWACASLRSLEFTFHPRVLFTKGRWRGEDSETIEQTDGSDGPLVQALDENQDSAQDTPHVEQSRQKQSEEHENRVEDKPSHEKESVRDDYFAMFRQLRRLSQLRSLHIYNSPGLNSFVNSLDSTETWIQQGSGPVGMVESPHVYEFVPDAPLSSQINTSLMQEDTTGGEGSSSSSSSNTAHTITDLTYRSNPESDSHELRLTLLANEDEVSNNTNSIQQSKSCRASVSSPVSLGSDPLDNLMGPVTLHPFSHKMGFKALGRLKNLRTLTLYERSSITLGQSEVRWIGNMFPQLSLLQLRGAIETSDDAIKLLKTRRPKIQVQVCSLFEN